MTQAIDIVNSADKFGYVDKDGIVWLDAEFVACGLGFVKTEEKISTTGGRKTYETVRWARVNAYLKEFGCAAKVGKGDFITENLFYMLAMKANNDAAKDFQKKIANEIMPSIRKFGVYLTADAAEKVISNPDFIINLAQQIKIAQAERDAALAQVAELQPKADYCEKVLTSDEALTSEMIAKEYGRPASWLNALLVKWNLWYKRGQNYFFYKPYDKRGYRIAVTAVVDGGRTFTNHHWTQKGREFVYNILKNHGILPLREREEPMDELF